MELAPQQTENSLRFQGAGCITQGNDGALEMTLYASQGPHQGQWFERKSASQAGQLIPQSELFELSAKDFYGRTWIARGIYPQPHYGVPKGCMVKASLREIICTESTRFTLKKGRVTLWILEELPVPCTMATETKTTINGETQLRSSRLNIAKVSSCGHDLEFEKGDRLVEVRIACPDESCTAGVGSKVCEALQFILGRPVRWSIMRVEGQGSDSAHIRPLRQPVATGHVAPPLPLDNLLVARHLWKLFGKYLEMVMAYEPASWHPLSWYLYSLTESRTPDGLALPLGVAVEGVLKTCYKELAVRDETIHKAVESLQEHLDTWTGPHKYRHRASSQIGMWLHANPQDKLNILQTAGLLTATDIAAWKKLRHGAAHGGNPDDRDFQELLTLCDQVLVLLYRLVLQYVGYEGQYKDYGKRGWPLCDFRPCVLTQTAPSTSGGGQVGLP